MNKRHAEGFALMFLGIWIALFGIGLEGETTFEGIVFVISWLVLMAGAFFLLVLAEEK